MQPAAFRPCSAKTRTQFPGRADDRLLWPEHAGGAGGGERLAAARSSRRGDIPARAHFVAVVTDAGLLDEMAQVPPMLETVDARVDELLRVLAVRGESFSANTIDPKEHRCD